MEENIKSIALLCFMLCISFLLYAEFVLQSLIFSSIDEKHTQQPILIGRIDEKTFVVYAAITNLSWSACRTDMDTILSLW
jgi:hypothetical protein